MSFPISIYWPGKPVPAWLEKITFSGESNGKVPAFFHNGLGVIVRKNGEFHVYGIAGTFIKVQGAGMSVKIEGQGGGVLYHSLL